VDGILDYFNTRICRIQNIKVVVLSTIDPEDLEKSNSPMVIDFYQNR
jgi:hypothetical protein